MTEEKKHDDAEFTKSEHLEDDEDLCSAVANLSSAIGSLMELDGGVLSKKRQARLSRMKRLIFDSLSYYCECLPQLVEDDEDKKD